MQNPSLYLDGAVLTSNHIHNAHSRQHAEIILQGIPNWECTLRLFVENVERELQKEDNQTWTLTQRPYVPSFPTMCTHW